jgi:MFS family permease
MSTGLFTGLPFGISVFFSLALSMLSDRMLGSGGDRTGKRRWMVALMMVFSTVIALLPFVDNIWVIVAIFTVALTATSTATGLNSALLTDLLASPSDAGKAHAVLVIGGNTFGTTAPIITGYVIANTGGFDATWYFCSALLIFGAVVVMSFTRGTIGVARDKQTAAQRIYASS